ncbi:glycoside hydrolase family 27 protein [Candidatus Nomurabacteria bacterium]|nr:glycoside hydrolase family 27 protein [Candidatus Nomurabacteria bacterium]
MVRLRIILLLAVLSLSLPLMGQKYENLGRTPQMGWNSWNKFASNINENLIKETADLMVSKGLLDAGYVYLNLDDCWHGERDSLGFISENSEKFPSGMKALGEYIHSKGLKFGIYSDAGCKTCGGHPGSLGHEYQDAVTYARWGVDYLKYDWCNTKDINPIGAYKLMRDALRFAGRPVFFSICELKLSS